MYAISALFEMGEAHEFVLSEVKEELVLEDTCPYSFPPEEYFDG
jgi:hypothetical protein